MGRLGVAIVLFPAPVLADRVVVVGSEADAVADVLRLELDAAGIEVVTDLERVAPATVPLEEAARFETLWTALDASGGSGIVEVVPTSEASARVLYLRGSDGVTRSREVSVSTPWTDADLRALALVLRTMIVAAAEPPSGADSPPPAQSPRARTAPSPRAAPSAIEPPRATILAGWNAWTRLDGDFFWHGPGVSGVLRVARRLAVEVRGALSLESSASSRLARAQTHDRVVGLLFATPLEPWLSLAVGVDLHALSSVVRRGDQHVPRETIAAAPMTTLCARFPAGPVEVASLLRFGYVTNDTSYAVGDDRVIAEGVWAIEAGIGVGPRF